MLISGRVQGVGFRWAIQRQAERLGVSGWVRNLSDGRVEARFEGHSHAVEDAVVFCREGPDSAWVDSVDVSEVDPEEASQFRVR